MLQEGTRAVSASVLGSAQDAATDPRTLAHTAHVQRQGRKAACFTFQAPCSILSPRQPGGSDKGPVHIPAMTSHPCGCKAEDVCRCQCMPSAASLDLAQQSVWPERPGWSSKVRAGTRLAPRPPSLKGPPLDDCRADCASGSRDSRIEAAQQAGIGGQGEFGMMLLDSRDTSEGQDL